MKYFFVEFFFLYSQLNYSSYKKRNSKSIERIISYEGSKLKNVVERATKKLVSFTLNANILLSMWPKLVKFFPLILMQV